MRRPQRESAGKALFKTMNRNLFVTTKLYFIVFVASLCNTLILFQDSAPMGELIFLIIINQLVTKLILFDYPYSFLNLGKTRYLA